jgi:hypothetical protein
MEKIKENNYPEICPITGRKFFMTIEYERGNFLPTYGGPFDSYTIPELDEDGDWVALRYDHDEGEWMGLSVVDSRLIIKTEE